MKKTFFILTMAAIAIASCKKDDGQSGAGSPTVTTAPVTNISASSATGGGNVTSEGSSGVLEKGVVWSLDANPTEGCATCFQTNDGAGTGPFVSTMNFSIVPLTTYHVRAFARNAAGIGYGSDITFTTTALSVPTLTTTAVSAITSNTASGGGTVTSDGGTVITTRGIVWSTSANPTINSQGVSSGSGVGVFVASLAGLTSNTLYHVRAYGVNVVGIGYGDDVTFTTSPGVGDAYQGGIIAYVLQVGDPGYNASVQHGLIAAPSDQSISIAWSVSLTTTGATSQLLGAGQANTTTIVANQGAGTYAAKLCDDLVIGAYSDWYLPSRTELNKLYLSKTLIGGFAVAFYWSSSEDTANAAWLQSFNSNSQSSGTKTTSYYVRAVRTF